MLRHFLFSVFLVPLFVFGQNSSSQISWVKLNEVEALMAKEPRKVLIDVYTSWCGPCRMMAENTFKNPSVVDYVNKHYYAIKFDAESGEDIHFKGTTYKNKDYDPAKTGRNATHELTMAIAPVNGRIAYPTVVYLDEDFKIVAPVQGYHTPQQIEPILKFIAEADYKTISFDQFKSSLTPTFK
jgi:thioredoxin-related protein